MVKKAIALLAFIAMQSASAATVPVPKDVQTFVKNADLCDHMAGEWDNELPKTERQNIEKSITKYCGPAKQQLHFLQEKYKDKPAVLKVISKHAYDSVKDYSENIGS